VSARALIMAGGTGGHIFPALAVAKFLQERGVSVTWLGTKTGLEAELIPKAGIEIDWITIGGIRGKGLLGWIMAPIRILKAVAQAASIISIRKPDVVLGMGGFATGPGGIAAWLKGKPLVIHEQNSIAGLTNRLLSRFSSKVLLAFPAAIRSDKAVVTGNPLRQEFSQVAAPEVRNTPRRVALNILVVGGSLGAKALNEVVPKALSLIPLERRPTVRHQCGKKNFDETVALYRELGVKAEISPFIEDVIEAYTWADLVICRAGALTVSELAAVGVASILVPFPHAVDDHQTTNGKYLVDGSAAILIQQNILTPELLLKTLEDLTDRPEKVKEMAINARKLAKTNATELVAKFCLEYAHV